jgi:hypothetical protein
MALMGTLTTLDPTGAIGTGLTDTGATIEKLPSRSLSPRPQLQRGVRPGVNQGRGRDQESERSVEAATDKKCSQDK